MGKYEYFPQTLNLGLQDCNFDQDHCGWNVNFEMNGTEFFQFVRSTGEMSLGRGNGPIGDHNADKNGETLLKMVKSNYFN